MVERKGRSPGGGPDPFLSSGSAALRDYGPVTKMAGSSKPSNVTEYV